MKYKRFEELPVWKAAADFYINVEAIVREGAFRSSGDLRGQLLRASLSISNNIAEGFERGSTNELLHFLYIARGSAGECRSMLQIMARLPGLSVLRSEISNLKSQSETISRQLRGWADSLQNSDIKGQRYLNDASREQYEQQRRASAFMQQIRAVTAEAVAQREAERLACMERECERADGAA